MLWDQSTPSYGFWGVGGTGSPRGCALAELMGLESIHWEKKRRGWGLQWGSEGSFHVLGVGNTGY